ncbi:MAG: hypothetical protein ACM3MG_00825 [Bacillota bacterium]
MDAFEGKLRQTFPDLDLSRDILSQLSSISIVTLIVEIESFHGIEIHPMEVEKENFSSYAAVQSFIERKKNGRR